MRTARAFTGLAIIAIMASCTQAGTEESKATALARAPGVESPHAVPVEAASVESRVSAPMKSCTCKEGGTCTCGEGSCTCAKGTGACGCGKSGSDCSCGKSAGSCGCGKTPVPEA